MYTGALFFAFSEAENGGRRRERCEKERDRDEESEPTRRSLFSLPMENNSFFPGALMNII
jgi:hypothetical protein